MKIRIYIPDEAKEMAFTLPTGFLFSKLGIYVFSRMLSSHTRKEYDKKAAELWKSGDLDDMISPEDVENAERLTPPITTGQARELFTALKDARYLMGGLPLVSINTAEGVKLRVDL